MSTYTGTYTVLALYLHSYSRSSELISREKKQTKFRLSYIHFNYLLFDFDIRILKTEFMTA